MQFPHCDLIPMGEGFYCHCVGCPVIGKEKGCILEREAEGIYRYEGETLHGGVRAYLYFTDSEGNLVPKEEAFYVEIREVDRKGNVLFVSYGVVDDTGFSPVPQPSGTT